MGDLVIFSGGSAANGLVDIFNQVIETKGCSLRYIIPISDNGGSSSELIRVLGGPGIGDVRSRLVRLIPDVPDSDPERHALKHFFNYRLSSDPEVARLEWLDIVEARHELWQGVPSARKELIRSFLSLLNLEIVKRVRPSSVFNYARASVGNMFLTGARLFSGSFESAIYLLSSICDIPSNVTVLPAINTNFSHHICAGLADGTTIAGQNEISHPSEVTALSPSHQAPSNGIFQPPLSDSASAAARQLHSETDQADTVEDANWPGSLPALRKPNLSFDKSASANDQLPSPIDRLWYINPYGQEIRPRANPQVVAALRQASCVVYSIGSLYTSILPNIILRGVGEAIGRGEAKQKILILNGTVDRETSSLSAGAFTALEFVRAIARAALESQGFVADSAAQLAAEEGVLRRYVTHVVYVEGEGTPPINKKRLLEEGIEPVRVYGRAAEGESGLTYDANGLTQTLVALIGRKDGRLDKSRRNTVIT